VLSKILDEKNILSNIESSITDSLSYDIVIIGGGPAGLSFACSLANTGLRLAIIEKQSLESLADPSFDGRDIALTHQSVRILKDLGAWARFREEDISPIEEAKVVNGTSPYSLDFDTSNEDISALGFLVSNHLIRKALYDQAIESSELEIMTGSTVVSVSCDDDHATVKLANGAALNATLVVAADSRFSETRRMVGIPASMHDFGRVCIVCRMEHENPHDKIAYECFHYDRTLAILPLNGNHSSIVVTAPMSHSDNIMGMSEEQFDHDIQVRFDERYGKMSLTTKRFAYPLVGVHAEKFCSTRFALIGDAAVGMHPVTAHGFNLGLSGQEILAKEIINSGSDVGNQRMLKRYETRHMFNSRAIYHGTNEIVRIFTDDRAPTKILRGAALKIANNFPPVKRLIRRKLTESQQDPGILPQLGQAFLDRIRT
jgi:ubiquinone biosynthesis UbiH/UbiF/VisC/COQ6 family hydroxylase